MCLNINDRINNSPIGIVLISNCFFQRNIIFNGNGGSIYFLDKIINLNISNSIFYKSICDGYGGAIYFSCQNTGNCNLSKICGIECNSSHSLFSHIITKMENVYKDISVSNCKQNDICLYILFIQNGKQLIELINTSKNSVYQVGIRFSFSLNVYLKFCNFYNNSTPGFMWICFEGGSGYCENSNFINNFQGTTTYGNFYIEDGGIFNINNFIF